jgi:two-component system, sensor histidine kinase and response regulator
MNNSHDQLRPPGGPSTNGRSDSGRDGLVDDLPATLLNGHALAPHSVAQGLATATAYRLPVALPEEIKIIVAEPLVAAAEPIVKVLAPMGYHVFVASTGKEVLQRLKADPSYTLILLNTHLPDVSGQALASEIGAQPLLGHIPIIFIANSLNDEQLITGYSVGAVDFLAKPINPDLLRAKVQVFIELFRKSQRLLQQEQTLLSINTELELRVQQRTEALLTNYTALAAKNDELARINNDLDTFMYAASHDLKGPLTNMMVLTELLVNMRSEQADEKERNLLSLMERSLSRFNRTIADLTLVTQVQKDYGGPREQVDLRELVEDIKGDLDSLITSTGAIIEENYTLGQVTYSRKNIRSVLYNLLSNAIKYHSPDRLPVVRLHCALQGGRPLITVRDNGLGLSPEQEGRLFGMFRRLHNHVEGSGIGLYMIKKILENNGGSISVSSVLDQGTQFTVLL